MTKKIKGNLRVENNHQVDGDLNLSNKTAQRALKIDASKNVVESTVTETELEHLSGVTSNVQTQIDSKANDADVIKKDGSADFTADQSMAGNKLTNLAAPTADNDAARKVDVDAAAAGMLPKDPVRVATTASINLGSAPAAIDGVTLSNGDRVLVKDGSSANPGAASIDNGIYVFNGAASAMTRATDFDGTPVGEVKGGNTAFVNEGTSPNVGSVFRLNGTGDKILGVDTLEFVIFSRAQDVTAGDGIDKNGLEVSVDASDIAGTGLEEDGSNNLRVSSTAAGTGLTGGSGSALSVDFGTTGQKAVSADTLASNSNAEGAALIGIEDSAANFTATDVEGALAEVQTNVDAKQNDVITTQGDLVLGDGSGEESRLPIGANGTVLQSDGSTASWQAISTADEQVKVSANDTTSKFLEDAVVASEGINSTNALEISTLNDGADEDLQIQLDETKIDHDNLQNFVANEHVDHSAVSIATAADSGLSGGGDITATRNLSVDIAGTTAETSISTSDEVLVQDVSAGALRKATLANVLAGLGIVSAGDIAETSFSMSNNQAAPADVTGLSFNAAVVRSFDILISVEVDATTDLFESFRILGIQKSGSWDIAVESTGDDTDVDFTITAAGQIQYTSASYAGFVSGDIKFRAVTTSI